MGTKWIDLPKGQSVALVAERVISLRLKDLARAMAFAYEHLRACADEATQPTDFVVELIPSPNSPNSLNASASNQNQTAAKAVHRLRVAARKADVALQAFRGYCKALDWRKTRSSIRVVRRLAGAVRDADVHLQVLAPLVSHGFLGASCVDAQKRIARERIEAMSLLVDACDPCAQSSLRDSAKRLHKGINPASHFPVDLVARTTLASLSAEASGFGPEDLIDLERLHELRLCVKRLRYAMETFGAVIDSAQRDRALVCLEEAQQRLGEVNDVAVLVDRLARYALEEPHYLDRSQVVLNSGQSGIRQSGIRQGTIAELRDRLIRVRDARHAKAATWWRTSDLPLALHAFRASAISQIEAPLVSVPRARVTTIVRTLDATIRPSHSRKLMQKIPEPIADMYSGEPISGLPALRIHPMNVNTPSIRPTQPEQNTPTNGHAKANEQVQRESKAHTPQPFYAHQPAQAITSLAKGMPDALSLAHTQRSLFVSGERLAAIDVGSNSLRLLAVELVDERSWRVLEEERAMTRLAHGLSATGMLSPEAMATSLEALVRFKSTCDRLGVRLCRAFATAAVREASNSADFRSLVLDRTGLSLEVISDRDEGRLVHRSVARAFDLSIGRCIVADIGGGSLEVVVSDGGVIVANESMPLGAVRLTEQFGGAEAAAGARFNDMKQTASRMIKKRVHTQGEPPSIMIGCGGTFSTLMTLAVAARGVLIDRNSTALTTMAPVSRQQIKELIAHLRSISLAQRLRVPGLPSDRADIIIAGFCVVERLMKHVGATHMHVHPGGVRDGLVLRVIEELLATRLGVGRDAGPEARVAGVRTFAYRCRFERAHSEHVAGLALMLFDQFATTSSLVPGLGSDPRERELLHAAALLHDVGVLVSYERHHKHSQVMILHGDLPGFTPREINVIAEVARYHRRAEPSEKHRTFAALSNSDRALIARLAAILRVADGLDRSHTQNIATAHVRFSGKAITIEADCRGYVQRAEDPSPTSEISNGTVDGDSYESLVVQSLNVQSLDAEELELEELERSGSDRAKDRTFARGAHVGLELAEEIAANLAAASDKAGLLEGLICMKIRFV